jgi:hypothetical protein
MIKQKILRRFFSLTGAAFNCSAYQHPRRGRGSDSITYFMQNITLAGRMLKGAICRLLTCILNWVQMY